MNDLHRLELIVVSYFGSRDLPQLLEGLVAQDHKDWRLTVVDNSGDEAEAGRLAGIIANIDRARLLRPERNEGYFGGARFALDAMSAGSAAAVVVSNADIGFSDPSTFSKIVSRAAKAQGVGLLAPRIVSQRSGLDQNPHLVARPTLHQQAVRRRRMAGPVRAQLTLLGSLLKRSIRRRSAPAITPGSAIYAPHGSFMVFLPDFFRLGGDFGHPIFLFAEELTVAERARELGLRVEYAPDISVEHVEHGQMGFFRSRRVLTEMSKAAAYGHSLIARGDRRR